VQVIAEGKHEMAGQRGRFDGLATDQERKLAMFAVDYLERMIVNRREAGATGDFTIKVQHHRGELREVHVDDHVKITAATFAGNV